MQEILCPSGLKGVLRHMKVKDQELFANKALVRNGTVISKLLENCWESTIDPGPYKFEGKPNWDKVLEADRLYALLQLRAASFTDNYDFKVTCKNCEAPFDWTVKLSELDVLDVSDAGKEWIKTQVPVPYTLPSGISVACRPLIGEDHIFFAEEHVPDEEIMTYHLARRLMRFGEITMWHLILKEIRELSVADSDSLWDFTEDLEGGVDTMFYIQCPRCRMQQRVILPFDEGFFSSRKKFSDSRKTRLRR